MSSQPTERMLSQIRRTIRFPRCGILPVLAALLALCVVPSRSADAADFEMELVGELGYSSMSLDEPASEDAVVLGSMDAGVGGSVAAVGLVSLSERLAIGGGFALEAAYAPGERFSHVLLAAGLGPEVRGRFGPIDVMAGARFELGYDLALFQSVSSLPPLSSHGDDFEALVLGAGLGLRGWYRFTEALGVGAGFDYRALSLREVPYIVGTAQQKHKEVGVVAVRLAVLVELRLL